MYKLEFEDRGQGAVTWAIDNEGYVVDCEPAQPGEWLGCQVLDPEHIQPGDLVDFVDTEGETRTMPYRVDSIILEAA